MLLTIDDLAAFLRLSKETIYKLAQRGEIPAIKIRAQWRFDRDEIDTWLKKNSNQSNNELLRTKHGNIESEMGRKT